MGAHEDQLRNIAHNRRARFSRPGCTVSGLLAIALLASGGVASASADAASDLWYFDAFHVADAHAAGFTGAGVTVAVIDTPVNTQVPTLASAHVDVQEPSPCRNSAGEFYPATSTSLSGVDTAVHGTEVLSLLVGSGAGYPDQVGVKGVAPGAHVLYYASAFSDGTQHGFACDPVGPVRSMAAAISDAVDKGARIISISQGGVSLSELDAAIAKAHRKGVVIVAALPNSTLDLTAPASENGVVAVQAIDKTGTVEVHSDGSPTSFDFTTVAGPGVDVLSQGYATWEQGARDTGTSMATPVVAGFLAVVLQKYPKATGNQLIQTLIHNTGKGNHELTHDNFLGYGVVSLTTMLTVDPTKYPDVNPLLTDNGNPPTMEQINGTASPTPTATDGESSGGAFIPVVGLIVGGLIGLLVIVGVVVLIVVLASRRARASKNAK